MRADDTIQRKVRRITRAAKEAVAQAHANPHGDETHVHVAKRTNVRVAANIGQFGSTRHAAAVQSAPIVQGSARRDAEGTDRDAERNG